MCTYTASIKQRAIQQGIRQGIQEGENKLSNLIQLLIAAGRTEDIAKATSNADARKKLYNEFGITDFEITD